MAHRTAPSIRTSAYLEIAGDASQQVRLKPREVGNLDWDNKLTLEFNGEHPSFHSISIEPIHEPTIYLAGDSTVVDQDVEPWTAWGQMLPRFLPSGIVIANHAESGRDNTQLCDRAAICQRLCRCFKPGDCLFIQFCTQ